MFLLAKEFGWTPNQIKYAESRDIKGITTVLSAYNRVRNEKAEQQARKASKRK